MFLRPELRLWCAGNTELEDTLRRLEGKVSLVVTDFQAFAKVMKIVPYDIYLTSFSILMARFKGQLDAAVNGAYVLDRLRMKASVQMRTADLQGYS